MADCWMLKEITIDGFRGFVKTNSFSTQEPFVLFDGPQGSGKSSTLVAIEWVLFGNEIAKKAIGIDERKGWKIRNTNSDEAKAEIVLQKGQDTLKVVRSDKKKKDTTDFYFELNGERDTDEVKLSEILKIQCKDYFSSVHLHQEIIRALLTEEPRSRKDSLDRLLGLSELRNIIEGIKHANITEILKDADNKFSLIENQLNAIIKNKETDIYKEKETGIDKGLSDNRFSETGAKQMCEELRTEIINYAKQTGLPIPDLPSANTLKEKQTFSNSAIQTLRKLRDEQPELKQQKELLEKQIQLQKLQQTHKELLDELRTLQQKKKHIIETEGDKEKIESKIKELKLKRNKAKIKRNEIDRRAGTVEEAIKYFEAIPFPTEEQPCPVCEKPIDSVSKLKIHLKELRDNLDKDLAPIREEIEKYDVQIVHLEDLMKSLSDLDKKITSTNEFLKEHKAKIETALGYEIKDTEDPFVVLENELGKLQKKLNNLERIIKEYNKKLNEIEDNLAKLDHILKVLILKAEIDDLIKIKETDEYKKVENYKSALEKFSSDVELISQAINTVLENTARAKLNAAKAKIVDIFKSLANRPDFSEIEIDPENFEIMAIKNDEKIPVLSIFNVGDLNCVGLSIFLGLGATQELSHNLGFLILDDPSQSLDNTHKENLVNILNSILDDKQILVSTSESDLSDLIMNKIVRKKKHYKFAPWTDDIKGVELEETQ